MYSQEYVDIIEFSLGACKKLVKISLENFENTKQNKTEQKQKYKGKSNQIKSFCRTQEGASL